MECTGEATDCCFYSCVSPWTLIYNLHSTQLVSGRVRDSVINPTAPPTTGESYLDLVLPESE